MKHLRVLAVLLCAAAVARGDAVAAAGGSGQAAHPAVVRVIVPDRDGTSFGSGALVAVNESHGLVITNWHVVRDMAGTITVMFPDGHYSLATVLRVDRDWDLAALAIQRPSVPPIPLAAQAARPGDLLTIAGYGKGDYRAASGYCTQYLSPGGSLPFELVELGVAAREGDSGGPILNNRGELAGVLFGAGFGRTAGSYCGRVRWFLTAVSDDFNRLPGRPAEPATMIARQQPPAAASPAAGRQSPAPPPVAAIGAPLPRSTQERIEATAAARPPVAAPPPHGWAPAAPSTPVQPAAASYTCLSDETTASLPVAGHFEGPPTEQIKTILAALGVVFLVFHALRLVAKAAG